MKNNKNFLEAILSFEGERSKLVGNEIVNMRSYSSLKLLSRFKGHSLPFVFLQSFLLLSLLWITLFLCFLYLKDFPLSAAGAFSADALQVCGYLMLFSFLLLGAAVFSRTLLKIWLSVLLGLVLAANLDIFFYDGFAHALDMPGARVALPVLFILVTLILVFAFWKLFFAVSLCSLGVALLFLVLALWRLDYPGYSASSGLAAGLDSRNILHIAVNSHAGFDAVYDRHQTYSTPLTYIMTGFYRTYGFELYPRLHTLHYEPPVQLASLLNFSSDIPSSLVRSKKSLFRINSSNGLDYLLMQDKYFSSLRAGGYDITVYQSGQLDVCKLAVASSVNRCYSYPQSYGLKKNKNLLLGAYFGALTASHDLPEGVLKFFHMFPIESFRSPASGLDFIDQLVTDMKAARGNNVFFVDTGVLKPPFSLDAHCQETVEKPGWAGYERQVACFYRSLSGLFDRLEQEGVLYDATVIVHGYSGARVYSPERYKLYGTSQGLSLVMDAYNTLFAVRTPTSRFSLNPTVCDVESVFVDKILGTQTECRPINLDYFSMESMSEYNKAWADAAARELVIDRNAAIAYYRRWLQRN